MYNHGIWPSHDPTTRLGVLSENIIGKSQVWVFPTEIRDLNFGSHSKSKKVDFSEGRKLFLGVKRYSHGKWPSHIPPIVIGGLSENIYDKS